MTDRSPKQTAAAIAQSVRAREVIIGVLPNAPSRPSDYAHVGDRMLSLSEASAEERRNTMHSAATCEWVLHVVADEVVSVALANRIPALISAGDVDGWQIPRRIVSADGDGWYDEAPWWPSAELRLVRRAADPHAPSGTVGWTDAPLLAAGAVVRTSAERERLVLEREVIELGGPGTLREPRVQVMLPERSASLPPTPLTAAERNAVRALSGDGTAAHLFGSGPLNVAATPTTASQDVRIELLERDLRFTAGELRHFLVRLTNDTRETWTSAGREDTPRHLLSYWWHLPDGTSIEGGRTSLPRPVAPGASEVAPVQIVAPAGVRTAELQVRIVHEWVRWLDGAGSATATISAPSSAPERREVRPGGSIPRVIHRVWLGERPMPKAHVEYGESWERLHPEWEVKLWTDETAPIPECAARARSISEVSDLVRYELVRQHGGVYVDTDIECLRPIDALIEGVEAFSAYEVPGRLCPALMGAVPKHPAFERLCELAELTVGHGTYPLNTATVLSTFVLEAMPTVTLFGPDRFYPELWDGTATGAGDEPYADHHWAKSWVE